MVFELLESGRSNDLELPLDIALLNMTWRRSRLVSNKEREEKVGRLDQTQWESSGTKTRCRLNFAASSSLLCK